MLSRTFPCKLLAGSVLALMACGEGLAELEDDEGGIAEEGVESVDTVESGLLSTLASDGFNRANAADVGAQWASGYTGQSTFKIVANQVKGTSTTRSIETFIGAKMPGNQFAQVTLAAVTSDSYPGVVVRFAQSPTMSGYSCRVRQGKAGYISKWTGGSQEYLRTVAATFVSGDKVRCEANGSKIKMYKIRAGTRYLVAEVTDTTYTEGRTGIVTYGLNGALDDFSAGDTGATADSNAGKLRMALVNLKSLYTDSSSPASNQKNLKTNLDRHLYFIDLAAQRGAEFVGFPELSINGYHFSPDMTWLKLSGPEVQVLAKKAIEKKIYISAGIAERDAQGKQWNTHFVLGPDGKMVGWHHKIWLTREKGFTEVGTDHNVFTVKGAKLGILICADGTNKNNLSALVRNGAQIVYVPHAGKYGSTIDGFYNFRKAWSGPNGWVAEYKVHAALHNQAARYNPQFNPPVSGSITAFASGAWFIGPDGATLAQMPSSTNPADSNEFLLLSDIPISAKK